VVTGGSAAFADNRGLGRSALAITVAATAALRIHQAAEQQSLL